MEDEIEKEKAEKTIVTEQILSNIIDFFPDPIIIIDKEGRVIIWNKATEELTGTLAVEVIGQEKYAAGLAFYGEKRPILIDLALESDDVLEKKYPLLKREGAVIIGENFTPKTLGGKGNCSWGRATTLCDENGNVIGAVEVVRDVTERKQQEDVLKKKITELEKMDGLAIERELRMAELKKTIKELQKKLGI